MHAVLGLQPEPTASQPLGVGAALREVEGICGHSEARRSKRGARLDRRGSVRWKPGGRASSGLTAMHLIISSAIAAESQGTASCRRLEKQRTAEERAAERARQAEGRLLRELQLHHSGAAGEHSAGWLQRGGTAEGTEQREKAAHRAAKTKTSNGRNSPAQRPLPRSILPPLRPCAPAAPVRTPGTNGAKQLTW